MSIVTCPKCKMRVLPGPDGTCPSCQAIISSEQGGIKRTSSYARLNLKVQPKTNKERISKVPSVTRKSAIKKIPDAPKFYRGETTTRDLPKPQVPTFQEISPQRNIRKQVSSAIFCQSCGREAQTKYVEYYQNIGVLIMRFSKKVKGHLCKVCSNKFFWSFTGTTLFLGWWGVISFFVTLFILPNNIIRYLGTLGLESPDPTTPPPTLTGIVIERIKPFTVELFQRVNAGEKTETVARSIATRASVSPGQVLAFAFALAQALKEKKE